MKISIVTVTFNNLPELEKTLESLPQSDSIESVVINGGDSKETTGYLKGYKGKVINEKDKGISDAFNKGILYSHGDAIMFLNSGDILYNKDYLLEAIKQFESDKSISFVHSNIIFDDPFGGELIMKPLMKNPGRGMRYLHPSMIVKKDVFNIAGGFDIRYDIAMDFDFILRMDMKGFKGVYLDLPPVVKMEGSGKSQAKEWQAIKECYRSLKVNDSLNRENIAGLAQRISLFFLRKTVMIVGGKRVMKVFKKMKYRGISEK
jgi:glycosyltransferase involved in cell wall biosynthesis